MNIRALVVSHAYPRHSTPWHGSFVHRWNLGLRAMGIEVHVFQLADWSPSWPFAAIDASWREAYEWRRDLHDDRDGIPIHHPLVFYPRPHRLFPRDPWEVQSRTLVRYCQRDARLRSADVVVGHFMVPDGYHALRLGEALGIPVVAVAWGDDVHAWPERLPTWRQHLQAVLKSINAPVACSQRLADDANRWLPSPRMDWKVIYGGVDLERFRPCAQSVQMRRDALPALAERLDDRSKVLLILGQRIIAKGYLELLDAWQRVYAGAPDWHLVMAGVDRGDVDVGAEIETRGLQRRAHWIGPVSDTAVILQASDAFVLPSHNEGLSLSVLEALATGLPVITTNVGGHAEVIRGPLEGWLIDPRNVEQLVGALRELVSLTEAEREQRSTAARRAAARIGTPRENAERFGQLLRESVSRPTAGLAAG
ncbi:MAG: glycosyltransferase [Gemmatimonadaceae bacterium]